MNSTVEKGEKMKALKLIPIFILILLMSSVAHAQTAGPSQGTSQPVNPHVTTPLQFNTLYASAGSDLWLIDASTGTATYIGPIGFQGTDIAFSGINLYGVDFSNFLSINPTTGSGTVIGPTGYSDINALAIGLDGVTYAAGGSGEFLNIENSTGEGSLIGSGSFGPNMGSSGDLAYRKDNVMFASITRTGYTDSWLAVVNMVNGTATPIGDIGYPDVFGLSFKDDVLYGVTAEGNILRINTSTGAGTSIGSSTAAFWGLSTSGKALTGSITSPSDYYSTGPASLQISATATYSGGNGIKQVEFYVFANNEWQSLGADTIAPYTANWSVPSNLQTQQVLFRIDVVGNDGYRADYAGGVRHVNIKQASSNPNIVENWVPQRAYLNQRSLSPHGDWKCNVSSLAMVLAMEGYIGLDYQSMADKANEMYPRVAPGDEASVYTMTKELKNQGADAQYFGPLLADDAWPYITAYIDAGHPVIVNSAPGNATSKGHFVVGVGYQENNGTNYLITYDPFGEWRGTTGSYFMNATGDPLSHVGQWVYYNFADFVGPKDNVYLIAAHSPSSGLSPNAVTASTSPDLTSDEPLISGIFEGFPQYNNRIFLPLTLANTSGLVNSDFESGSTGWAEYSLLNYALITSSFPVTAHSGIYAAWLGGADSAIDYIEQQVTIPASAPYLVYWQWISSEDVCGYDYGGVLLNGSVVDVYDLCSSTNTGGWVTHSVDLSAYAGQSVMLQIRIETDSSNISNLYIDDVSFQATAAASVQNKPVVPTPEIFTARGKSGIIVQNSAPLGTIEKRLFPIHVK